MGRKHKHAMWVHYSADQTRQEKGSLLAFLSIASFQSIR